MDEIAQTFVGSRLRFAALFAVVVAVAAATNYVTANWNPDFRLALFFLLAVVQMGVCALRFRFLGMNEFWALIGFVPVVGFISMLVFLLAKGTPAIERYSAF